MVSPAAAAYGKVTRRLIPFLFVCYVVAYLDRVNLGFAKLEMMGSLGMSDTVYGIGAGVFFLGYFLFEVPSNLILHRVGARIWIGRIMISWGLISGAMVWVRSPATFYVLRFCLGLAEAGFFPGIIYYLTTWYPSPRRARIIALFMTGIPISSVVGGPISGGILHACTGAGRLAGWQWLFLLEAIPAVVLGVTALFYLKDGIGEVAWLTAEEKAFLRSELSTDAPVGPVPKAGAAFRNPQTWLAIVVYFPFCAGLYGVGFWLPTLIKSAGVADPFRIGLLTAIPWAVGAVAMVLNGRSSDRHNERRWHMAVPAFLCGLGLIGGALAGQHLLATMATLTVATLGITAGLPQVWTLPRAVLSGAAAAAGIAFINSAGNLGGFLGPLLIGWIRDLTHSTAAGLYLLAALMFVGGVCALLFPKAAARP